MKYLRLTTGFFSLFFLTGFSGCVDPPKEKTAEPGTIVLSFNHFFRNKALRFAPDSFITKAGDTIRISECKYYISNITLTKSDGSTWNAGNYSLVDVEVPKNIILTKVPAGTYNRISFLVGVDASRNHSGAQDGDLDPSWGMSWTWNTGYIFFRLKGFYTSINKGFSFDLGGDDNIMSAHFNFDPVIIDANSKTISVKSDMNAFFETPNLYDLKKDTNDIHTASTEGILKLRDNVNSGVFSFMSVQ